MAFVHLHCHSHFTFLSGVGAPEEVAVRAAELGMPAVALTDLNGLYGVIPFYRRCLELGIRPLIGAEVEDGRERAVLIAEDMRAYSAISRIVTRRHTEEGFSLRRAILDEGGAPVIILTGRAPLIKGLRGCIPGDRVFMEVTVWRRDGKSGVDRARAKMEWARGEGVRCVATGDVHFLKKEDFQVHRLLRAMGERRTLRTLPAVRHSPAGAYFKGEGEMASLFSWDREGGRCLKNTLEVAERCRVDLLPGRFLFPPYPVPEGETAPSFLKRICRARAAVLYDPLPPAVLQRMDKELSVIESLGYTDYFLALHEIVEFSRESGIPLVGRGSAANSIVSYLLGITPVDPMRYNLYFERFLNRGRKDPPDVDIDFCWRRRDEVIDYISRRFGRGRVASISTFVRFGARSAVRETGRAMGLPERLLSEFTSRLPLFGSVKEIPKAVKVLPECRDLPVDEEPFRSVLKGGMALDGCPRHLSVHCGGMVISPVPIMDIIPLERAPKGVLITQMDMHGVREMGLVKMDILGQRSLSVIGDTLSHLKSEGVEIDFSRLDPTGDEKTKELIRRGETMGCFYIESPVMRGLFRKLDLTSFELLVAASSIIRPGVSNSGMTRKFILRHRGMEPVKYLHPIMEEHLKETYGIMIYQEDVMKVASELAGMSMEEADGIRRCMSKKGEWEAMETFRAKFMEGVMARGVEREKAGEIWRQMEAFSGYAFCKAHSASYAVISYRAAFLKAHFPGPFMAFVLRNGGGFYPSCGYVEEARRMGINVLPPHVERSGENFAPEGRDSIRVGLSSVKGLSLATVRRIISLRGEGFPSLARFYRRVRPKKGEAEALIKAGAFDHLGLPRPSLLWELKRLEMEERGGGLAGSWRPLLLEDYPHKRRTSLEEEYLGFPITLPGPSACRSLLKGGAVNPILSDEIPCHRGERVTLSGMVVAMRRTLTKGGEFMLFLTMEDEKGLFEVTLFPGPYRRVGGRLVHRGPYLIEGRVEDDMGNLTIECTGLRPLFDNLSRAISGRLDSQ